MTCPFVLGSTISNPDNFEDCPRAIFYFFNKAGKKTYFCLL